MPRKRSTRRTAGSGSVVYDKARRRYLGRVVQADGSRKTVTAPTKEEVIKRLNILLGKGPTPASEDSSMTVEQWLRYWLTNVVPYRPKAKSPQTVDNIRWAVETHLIPGVGRRKLDQLSAEDVEYMLRKRADGGMARSSVIRLRTVLALALDEAIRRERLSRNNMARIAVLPETRTSAERRSLSPAEAKKLLGAAAQEKRKTKKGTEVTVENGALVPVGLMLGLRPGELTGLVWANVDFKTKRLTVDKALVRGPGSQLTREEPKTKKSRRVIDMPTPVVDALRKHQKAQKVRRVSGEDFVFKTLAGTPLDPSNLRRVFNEFCDDAGIGSWTPNELRHNAASLLSAGGVPMDQAADLLGHSDTRMLDRHYRHATTKSYGAAVQPMEDLFGAKAADQGG